MLKYALENTAKGKINYADIYDEKEVEGQQKTLLISSISL